MIVLLALFYIKKRYLTFFYYDVQRITDLVYPPRASNSAGQNDSIRQFKKIYDKLPLIKPDSYLMINLNPSYCISL